MLELIKSIRAATSEHFLIGVRISPKIEKEGIYLEDSLELARYYAKPRSICCIFHAGMYSKKSETATRKALLNGLGMLFPRFPTDLYGRYMGCQGCSVADR